MTIKTEDKERLALEAKRRQNLQRVKMGWSAVLNERRKAGILSVYLLGAAILFFIIDTANAKTFPLGIADLLTVLNFLLFAALLIFGAALVLWRLGTPWGTRAIEDAVKRAGIVNHTGEAPMLCRKYRDTKNSRVTVLEFLSNGVPLKLWHDRQDALETSLNRSIAKITEGRDKQHVLVYTVSAGCVLPERLVWRDEYTDTSRGFKLLLGESLLGPVLVDLAKIPHVLLGGSTGSGKTLLLKLLIWQCLQKNAKVILADFKGGVDYTGIWRRECRMVCDEAALLDALTEAVNELEHRKECFPFRDAANIDEYNERAPWPTYDRIVIAFDEIAEVLDKNGLNKEQKELVAKIESKLSIIARQGRAFGIHLLLATQRPDATILSGQIRNNIDFRVCGRADNVLSQIILDNTSASEKISPDVQGRFITKDGTIFQAYLPPDDGR